MITLINAKKLPQHVIDNIVNKATECMFMCYWDNNNCEFLYQGNWDYDSDLNILKNFINNAIETVYLIET